MEKKVVVLSVAAMGFLACGTWLNLDRWMESGELVLNHSPARYGHRSATLSANVTGRWRGDGPVDYRVNQGDWQHLALTGPRMLDGWFAIEMLESELRHGPNSLLVRAGDREQRVQFEYDPDPVQLPIVRDWGEGELEAQDGAWAVTSLDGTSWVHPVPGSEGYDRILTVSGAFAGSRRVTVDMVFRRTTHPGRMFGFGVIPFWAGHLDEPEQRPRRGWSYGIAWYYSRYEGAGVEFSRKVGDQAMDWVSCYRGLELSPGQRYRLVVEAESHATGLRQRLKWWAADAAEPRDWLELSDRPGAALQAKEFAVALVAHRCQVEFGPVEVVSIPESSTESR